MSSRALKIVRWESEPEGQSLPIGSSPQCHQAQTDGQCRRWESGALAGIDPGPDGSGEAGGTNVGSRL